jgi:hypothetical protein
MKQLLSLLVVLYSITIYSQDATRILMPNIRLTGDETGILKPDQLPVLPRELSFPPVVNRELTFNFTATAVTTGYDLQSNGSSQEIWSHPYSSDKVHMVFTKSAQTGGWSDRNGVYLYSSNSGQTWVNFGNIQLGTTSRGGFVVIDGMNDGRPVAGLHNNDQITPATRTQIYVRNTAGTNWVKYNPGPASDGEPIWPNVLGVGTSKVVLTSAINGAPFGDFFTNTLDLNTGLFSGWYSIPGDQAETQNIAKSSDEQIIGLAYIGAGDDSSSFGDMYYRQSTDGGLSWGSAQLVYGYNWTDSLGAIRGVDIIFLGNNPYVVFELVKQDFSAGSYFPSSPNKIMLWSPVLNGGVAKVIADSNNIPYHENPNASNDVTAPLCRPTIGKTFNDQALFVTINATTESQLIVGTNANAYYAGYFMYSTDGGSSFSTPEKFTPSQPLLDWRFISLNSVNYVDSLNRAYVMMSAQADTIPGSNINAPVGYPLSLSAQLIFISTEVQLYTPVELINFTAGTSGNSILLNWKTATEINNFGFEVQRSCDSQNWEVLGFLSGYGTSSEEHDYSFEDPDVSSGKYYYRLKQIDNDGSFEYSLIIEAEMLLPEGFLLYQNYPNPFNPETNIKFRLANSGMVSLKIYDMLGNEVVTLLNEELPAGTHEIQYNAGELSSGVYLLKIVSGTFSDVKKLQLLK